MIIRSPYNFLSIPTQFYLFLVFWLISIFPTQCSVNAKLTQLKPFHWVNFCLDCISMSRMLAWLLTVTFSLKIIIWTFVNTLTILLVLNILIGNHIADTTFCQCNAKLTQLWPFQFGQLLFGLVYVIDTGMALNNNLQLAVIKVIFNAGALIPIIGMIFEMKNSLF